MRRLAIAIVILMHPPGFAGDAPTPEAVVQTHAELAWRSYSSAQVQATVLVEAIDRFCAAPDEAGLAACREVWRAAHDAYSPSEVFRFQDGPIDRDGGPETKINAWPLDEQWVDATVDDPTSGLVNTGDVALTAEVLIAYNERDGEKNIATGYHVIEFLLWGQDRDPKGPGNRPLTDFTTAPQADRRRQYLQTAARLLVTHLSQVQAEWAPGAANFRHRLITGDPAVGLHAAFTGLVMLAGDELSGERLAVAYETQDQEEEQSCFSDHTWSDIQGNIAGMHMVWTGTMGAWHGPALRDLVAARSATAAQGMDAAIATSIAAGKAIPQPFDQTLLGGNDSPGRAALLACIEALEAQADATVVAARAVGTTLDFGANANNAIVGCKEILENASEILQLLKTGKRVEAAATADAMFKRWLTIESAITPIAPTIYREIEAALFGLRSAAKVDEPAMATVVSRRVALQAAIGRVLPLLKQ